MNITPLIPGSVNAQGATPSLPANPSLADLLFADSPANAGQDFRTIAAALFGVESSTANRIQLPAKGPTAEKRTVNDSAQDRLDTRKSEKASGPNSGTPPAELTVPPFIVLQVNIPQPVLEIAPPPEPSAATRALTDIDVRLQNPATLSGNTKTANDHSPVPETTLKNAFIPSLTLEPITPPAAPNGTDMKGQATPNGDSKNKLPPHPADSAPLVETLATPDKLKPAKESPVQIPSVPANDTSAKKPAVHGSREPAAIRTVRPASTPAINADAPPLLPDADAAANPIQQPLPLTDPLTSAVALQQTSVVSAKEILDSSIATKAAPQSNSTKLGLFADSRSVSGPVMTGGVLKMKTPATKGTNIEALRNGKFAHIEADTVESGLTKSIATNSKDIAGVTLATHSDAHAKSASLKQATLSPSAASTVAETDAPDEALPTSAPSPVTARLVQGMSQAEFRVGMQSPEFGNIDIRTSVARHMFSAQISVEHGDMARSMTADLPALYHKLADQQVAVANIVIQGQSLGTSSGLAQDAQPQNWKPQGNAASSPDAQLVLPVMTPEAMDPTGRLDIRI